MAYATKTSNIMDKPLSISSVFHPYVGDNGYKFIDVNSIRVLSVANGSIANYDENSATAPFGSPSLVVPDEQVLAIAYNKSMLLRIQRTQIQDTGVSQFAKDVAMQQIDQVFIPAHDAYSLAKVLAARPVGNKVVFDANAGTNNIKLQFARMLDKARTGGADLNQGIAWTGFETATVLSDAINFTGSDAGYADGKKGYLGKFKGATVVECPDAYLGAGVYSLFADKRSIINVTPKMDPKNGGMKVLEDVPLFSGVEIQLRDRADTFVLNKKVNTIASMEND